MTLPYHAQTGSLQNAPRRIRNRAPSNLNSDKSVGDVFLTWLFIFSALILAAGVVSALASAMQLVSNS